MPLTTKQQRFYDLLRDSFTALGRAPTLEELKEHLESNGWGEIRSLNSLTQYLDALESAHKIRRHGGKCGIEFTETAEMVQVPFLPQPVSCGSPTHLIEEQATEHLAISRKLVHSPDRTYAFRTSGDSMNLDGIDDGDIVLVEATSDVRDGDRVLASINGMGTVKRFRKNEYAVTLLPKSSNQSHTPIYLHESDDFLIGGKVIGILKN
jgi:repressor LexA